jgi:hypothetical protein
MQSAPYTDENENESEGEVSVKVKRQVVHSFGKVFMMSKSGMKEEKPMLWGVGSKLDFGKMYGWGSVL